MGESYESKEDQSLNLFFNKTMKVSTDIEIKLSQDEAYELIKILNISNVERDSFASRLRELLCKELENN